MLLTQIVDRVINISKLFYCCKQRFLEPRYIDKMPLASA